MEFWLSALHSISIATNDVELPLHKTVVPRSIHTSFTIHIAEQLDGVSHVWTIFFFLSSGPGLPVKHCSE